MKKNILICFLALVTACSNNKASSSGSTKFNEDYCKSIISPEMDVYNAEITDANVLIIAVERAGDANFDMFAKAYLDDALSNGVDVDACMVVDVNNSQFQQGAVVGERIGEAFK